MGGRQWTAHKEAWTEGIEDEWLEWYHLTPEAWERAWATLDEAIREPVDLVRIETANAPLREAIARDGRLLYET